MPLVGRPRTFIEKSAMAAHESKRTTKLYERTHDETIIGRADHDFIDERQRDG
jgi:hypothetical protein